MKRLLIALSLATTAFALEQAATPLEQAGPSAQDFHRWLQESAQGHDWWAVIDYADILSGNFPDSPYSQDAPFLMGEAYLQLGQLEMANQSLSDYLQQTGSLNHFEEALTYKFEIA
jgi:outer membrane protein assembly factor BamD (BamD/ComL family)